MVESRFGSTRRGSDRFRCRIACARRAPPGVKAPAQENPQAARADDRPVQEVKPGQAPVRSDRAGLSGSLPSQEAFSQVEGRTTIISILPDGSQVKKGELVCELDSAALKDMLVNQTITTKSAEAAYQNAKLAREVAEIALTEYVEGILKQDRKTLKTTIASAEIGHSEGKRPAGADSERPEAGERCVGHESWGRDPCRYGGRA